MKRKYSSFQLKVSLFILQFYIRYKGKTLGGISYHYKEQYFPELEPYIDFDDFQQVMTDINETVKSFWPCFFTICLGYVLCPVTLGLSLLLPR